jgi:hypothetical protein
VISEWCNKIIFKEAVMAYLSIISAYDCKGCEEG